ncbi:hypothetical protein PHLCEN_2v2972 [Hermanssonia centrifuga]|uniref:DUF6533 domain-containing protein n=1 Tax=Hermanssonia centrifuga TaxID=98765 RepID=A0A2R6REQ4_9APHY|nr:hypothetical protein PHLCEN_2v2972 [Hermanssonia centrifuga]
MLTDLIVFFTELALSVMSKASSNSSLIAYYEVIQANSYTDIAMLALAVYEYTITVGREIQLVWKRPKTGSVWLFLATRYLMILSFVPQIIPVASSGLPC